MLVGVKPTQLTYCVTFIGYQYASADMDMGQLFETQPNPQHVVHQPNPFPYILSRDYIVCHTVNFLVQSTHTISPQNINVGC